MGGARLISHRESEEVGHRSLAHLVSVTSVAAPGTRASVDGAAPPVAFPCSRHRGTSLARRHRLLAPARTWVAPISPLHDHSHGHGQLAYGAGLGPANNTMLGIEDKGKRHGQRNEEDLKKEIIMPKRLRSVPDCRDGHCQSCELETSPRTAGSGRSS